MDAVLMILGTHIFLSKTTFYSSTQVPTGLQQKQKLDSLSPYPQLSAQTEMEVIQ